MISIRRLLLTALVSVPLVLAGCELFTIHEHIDEQLVPGNPVPSASSLEFPTPLQVDVAEETKARNMGPARHVYLSSLRLDITKSQQQQQGDAGNFDFIDKAEIYVESTKAGSTLPRVRMAHLESVPRGVQTLSFDRDDVDLLHYLNEGAKITCRVTGTYPPHDTTFDGDVALWVQIL